MADLQPSPARASAAGRGRTAALALALLAAACIAFAATAVQAGAAVPPLRTGVSYVLSNEEPAVAVHHVRNAGAQFIQTPIRWSDVAPSVKPAAWEPWNPGDPHYSWEKIDAWVQSATNAGLTPVLQIRSAPPWTQRCPPHLIDTGAPCNPDPADLAAFATAAASRYSGYFNGLPRVRYWQGMNEPNLSLFFMPQYEGDRPVSPDLYRDLINSFYAAIKAVHPSNLVIAAGLGPIAVPKYTVGPMRFARMLLCMTGGNKHPRPTKSDCGGGVDFDIFDVHPYTTGGPTHEGGVNDVQLGDLEKLTRLLRAADRAGRINGAFEQTPLWITEFSWDSNPPDPGGLPMRILDRWAAEALHEAWTAGVQTFFWFTLRDSPTDHLPYGETLQSGLYYRGATVAQDQPKEVLQVFRFPFVAYPGGGLSFWGRTPNSRGGKVVIQAESNGGWKKIAVVRASKAGIFKGVAGSSYGKNKKGAVRAHYKGQSSVPFSMRHIPDFPHAPFGGKAG